ncbi:UvrD-helicase domain-containing protein [Nocardia carnea]|uniref:UvrD-helicase domain-containing protein n=1 Tax=Nocardia carnea TaxID=37328 RepID=UPI002457D551|nr:UvrD-helicase domain-containing protein [Nocardia carnea]
MPDIHRERRLRWAERTLADIPGLSAQQRRCLSVPLTERGWHILVEHTAAHRGRAGTFVIGPAGVYALVFADEMPDWSRLVRIRKQAEEVCAGVRFDSAEFVPHMLELVVVMPEAGRDQLYDQFPVVDESTIRQLLLRGDKKWPPRRARALAAEIAERTPAARWISADNGPVHTPTAPDGLFGTGELHVDAREQILIRPFREWMCFLDPAQLAAVQTNYTGPARISGPAGTGKSVVALHRMARFAKQNPGRLLLTGFVKTLPQYHASGFAQLAPRAVDRAEFRGLHSWILTFLNRREVAFKLNSAAQNTAFSHAWTRAREFLNTIEHTDVQYWRDEIDRVIGGRGLTDCDEYLQIKRSGRDGVQLNRTQRTALWNHLYAPYKANLRSRGVDDFNDLVRKALDELNRRPLDSGEDYALVVVDEVQDLTLQELRLVHRIAGGGPDAPLLLVGDGQQQVYPGGWRLSDAGIPIRGRGNVLRTNYRNREAILNYVQQIEAGNTVDDLDGGRGFVLRDSNAVLPGGTVIVKQLRRGEVDTALVAAVAEFRKPESDIAVIVGSNKDADRILTVLKRAGLPVLALDKYDGTQVATVKVGTVHRAKGMDFEAVFVITEPSATFRNTTGAARDRAELRARQELVAASRPRDFLWVGTITG